jgi:hypothetical protein
LGMRPCGCGHQPQELAAIRGAVRAGVQHWDSVMAAGSYANSALRHAHSAHVERSSIGSASTDSAGNWTRTDFLRSTGLSAPGSLVFAHQFDIRLTAEIAALRRA